MNFLISFLFILFLLRKLSRHGYLFQERGLVDIKGKGSMVTYFLVGNPVRTVKQPQDEFTNNPSLVIVEDATSTSSPHDEDNSEQAAADLCPFASSSSVCRSVHDSENIGSPHVKKDGICHFPVSQDINKNLRFKSAKERSFSKSQPDLSKQGCLSNGINVVCRQSDSKICSMFWTQIETTFIFVTRIGYLREKREVWRGGVNLTLNGVLKYAARFETSFIFVAWIGISGEDG